MENKSVAIIAMGEGWHNYHHVFPWDYRAAELGLKNSLTTKVIDLFASVGWAYDMKSVTPEVLQARVLRTGDGSHPVWGWGDKDVPQEQWNKLKGNSMKANSPLAGVQSLEGIFLSRRANRG